LPRENHSRKRAPKKRGGDNGDKENKEMKKSSGTPQRGTLNIYEIFTHFSSDGPKVRGAPAGQLREPDSLL
jgi:hypothetical protein